MTESRMKAIRMAHKMTQQEFADKIGCSIITVKRHEKDDSLPQSEAILRNIRQLAAKAKITIS